MLYNPSISTSNIEFKYISGKNWNIQPARFLPPEDGAVMKYEDGELMWEYPSRDIPGFVTGYGMYTDSSGKTNRYAYMRTSGEDNSTIRIVNNSTPNNSMLSLGETGGQRGVNLQIHSYNRTEGASGEGSYIGGGTDNVASGEGSTVGGGIGNTASGTGSTVSGGSNNSAVGDYSAIGGGANNTAGGRASTIFGGLGNSASADYSTACGVFNDDNGRVFMVGNGTEDDPSNAFSVEEDGVLYAKKFTTPQGDYAEMYESLSGDAIEVGITIVFEGEYIRPCRRDEIPVGVISDTAGIVLNTAAEHWHGKYITENVEVDDTIPITRPVEKSYTKDTQRDGKWYREEVKYVDNEQVYDVVGVYDKRSVTGSSDNILRTKSVLCTEKVGTKIVKQRTINPQWDSSKRYIPRSSRQEWNVVGLLGRCKVRRDQPVNPRWVILEEHELYDLYLIR